MTKKERMISAINGEEVDAVPCGFSLHFEKLLAFGDAGVKSHLDFYKETEIDILKIMNENLVPDVGDILVPEDWNKIAAISLSDDFMKSQIEMTKKIVESCTKDDFITATIHSICACAIHPIEARYGYEKVRELICKHLRENKKPVIEAFQRITDGMCLLIKKYIELGVDGVYIAALGGEKRYFTDDEFSEFIKPFDLQLLKAVKDAGGYSFLHICKDGLVMERYREYGQYADVVNWGVYETDFSLEEGKAFFNTSTIMGGLKNRSGVMVDGTLEELSQEVTRVVKTFGKKGFILGADCSLPTEIPYERLKTIAKTLRCL